MGKKRGPGRPKGSKNKPKPGKGLFNPTNFVDEQEEGEALPARSVESSLVPTAPKESDFALDIYRRIPQYEAQARKFLEDEGALEDYVQLNALVLLQMERDCAVLIPTTRSEISASIKSRFNFVQKATELIQLLVSNRTIRIREVEAKIELLARQEALPQEEQPE